MMKYTPLLSLSLLLIVSGGIAGSVYAQEEDALEEVIVTGSYIKSSPTDGASPVDIVSRDDIDEMAVLDISDITRNITANSGAEIVPDSFTSGALQGTSNVNLRGLGLGSTLVLVNGRRNTLAAATANDGSSFVDTSMIPSIAVQRVEVLKEGAASIYGSDAVAGVVNYITRDDFEGTEIGTFYQSTTADSQKDKQFSILHGWSNDALHVVFAASYLDRSPLSSADRPQLTERGISTLGNSFLTFASSTVASGPYAGTYRPFYNVPDANCVTSGGIIIPQFTPAGDPNGERCGFLYGPRFNVVNEEERTHFYGKVKYEVEGGTELSVEVMWANVEVLDNPQSPSYPALSYLAPANAVQPGQAGNPFGVPILWLGRPLGSAFPSPIAPRDNEHFRIAYELDGEVGNYHYNVAVTHSAYEGAGTQPDTSTSRFRDAIRGVGGPNGDMSWNLFDPSANSQALIDYVTVAQKTTTDTALTVYDFVIDGEIGEVGFAAGMQARYESLEIRRNDISRVEFDEAGNLTKFADLLFLGGGINVDESRSSVALFSEFQWDATESLELRFAGRYEELDSDTTFDPKLSARYQATDDLVLRASISSSFREASLHQLYASSVGLQGIQDFNADGTSKGGVVFIRIAQDANDQLDAEQANNLNLGAIWEPIDSLHITLDYWSVDYTDVITIESAQGKVAADRDQPDVKRTAGDTLIGVTTNYFNAAEVDTDGFDLGIKYAFPQTELGEFSIKMDLTRMLSYEIPIGGRTTDVVGLFNHDNFARSLPEIKSNTTFRWQQGQHKASIAGRYISSYKTTRGGVPAGYSQNIDSHLTWDLQYNYELSAVSVDTRITIGVLNATDEEPPQVWDAANFSYDSRQHDARGRLTYIGLKFRM